ncbi:MAG TPA: hypothetical protein DD671_06160 [Balneolaceae bacterium]|nr:hypothetical protein [Balneola sp.]HBQ59203.1 hypothetical protein [Balneolaceae bacterium]|tara:strand:- start:9303 stop:9569 length:267 start_codon:yes stop_codon:yes gene_type:complete
MEAISVGLAIALIVLGIIGILAAGVKSVINGKQDYKRVAMMAVPFIVFGISYALFGEIPKAGVFTAVFMLGTMVVTIVLTGLRGTFKF